MKDAAERLEKLPAMLTHEGEAPVVAVLRRDLPVLAVLPWDLYIGLLQTLASLPEDLLNTQAAGVRALLADATAMQTPDTPSERPPNRAANRPASRPAHKRRPSR
jgi:hypothetical protein